MSKIFNGKSFVSGNQISLREPDVLITEFDQNLKKKIDSQKKRMM